MLFSQYFKEETASADIAQATGTLNKHPKHSKYCECEECQKISEGSGKWIVVIDDKKYGKNQQYTKPMDKETAQKRAQTLKDDMKTSIPKYRFAKNIKVINVNDFKGKLEESPVGLVGRTGFADAAVHVTPLLRAEFKKIVKRLGGKTVARQLLAEMNAGGPLQEGSECSTAQNALEKLLKTNISTRLENSVNTVLDLIDTDC